MRLPALPKEKAFVILRVVLGIIFITHAIARIYYQSVGDFGDFLDQKGLPLGNLLAWTVTIGELISGTLLVFGIAVAYCALFHAVVILSGIILVHLPKGWFVVGPGLDGVEYSVLLLAALLFVYSHASEKK